MDWHTEFMINWINRFKCKRIVEVGVHEGVTAKNVQEQCSSIQEYFLVDPWIEYSGIGAGSLAKIDQAGWEEIYNSVCDHFKDDPRFIIKRMSSVAASLLFEKDSLDVVFIDALHTYDACRQDIRAWLPKVKSNGCLCGDDFHDRADIQKAVRKSFLKFDLDHKGRVWFVRPRDVKRT